MNILGVRIDKVNLPEAKKKFCDFFNSSQQFMVFTPNPEMLVKSQKDNYFKEILNKGSLNLADGKGLQLITLGKLKTIPGVDFMQVICSLAEDLDKKVFFLGSGSQVVIDKLQKKIKNNYPKLQIVGTHLGLKIEEQMVLDGKINYTKEENIKIIEKINQSKAEILFVAFGMGKQEKWIYENLSKMSSVKIAMGVGGSFDFLSGEIKRAPQWVRSIWMEWMWRLINQPKRIGRIYNATFKFLFLFLFKK